MKRLTSTRTAALDATMFRSALSLPLSPLPISSPELHPIILQTKLLHSPDIAFSDLKFELGRYWADEQCSLSQLVEMDECATQPPTPEARISLWSSAWVDSASEEDEKEAGVALISSTFDAQGTKQPVTVERFIVAFLSAMESVHANFWDEELENVLEGWSFRGWKTKSVDERGCLYLEDPIWMHRAGTGRRFGVSALERNGAGQLRFVLTFRLDATYAEDGE